MKSAISKEPPKTYFMLRSISVLFSSKSSPPIRFFICDIPTLKEETIVGIALIREIRPPVATAPAPMYRIYLDQIWLDDISRISAVGSGARTEVSPSPK